MILKYYILLVKIDILSIPIKACQTTKKISTRSYSCTQSKLLQKHYWLYKQQSINEIVNQIFFFLLRARSFNLLETDFLHLYFIRLLNRRIKYKQTYKLNRLCFTNVPYFKIIIFFQLSETNTVNKFLVLLILSFFWRLVLALISF